MVEKKKNLSDVSFSKNLNFNNKKFGVVVSEWNKEVTTSLLNGALETLKQIGISDSNIIVKYVPGSYELTLGAQYMATYSEVDAIICLGCIVQGETRHFDFICQAVAQGIKDLNIKFNIPITFGVLTTNNMGQAIDRAGGKHGNKGTEAAATAIKMIELKDSFFTK